MMKLLTYVKGFTENSTNVRFSFTKNISGIITAIAVSMVSSSSQALSTSDYAMPWGWSILEKSTVTGTHYANVHTYKNTPDSNSGSYTSSVALVDIPKGARIDMMQYYAGQNTNNFPTFYRGTIDYWWNQMPLSSSRVAAVNAQFFNTSINPTTLSYAIKDNGHLYDSSDPNSATNARQVNIYPNNTVTVTSANNGMYLEQYAPIAIVGKSIDSLPSPDYAIGRTYLCAKPTYRGNNVLLVYVTKRKTQQDANNELATWGCYNNNTVGMDGSGSTQFRTKAGNFLYGVSNPFTAGEDRRTIPQVIGIYNDAN